MTWALDRFIANTPTHDMSLKKRTDTINPNITIDSNKAVSVYKDFFIGLFLCRASWLCFRESKHTKRS